jgi:hypothetical protein
MALVLPVPVYFLDEGPHVAAAQWYWQGLLRAHRAEMEATFGVLRPSPGEDHGTAWIAELPTPAVVIVPAIGGGRVRKDWTAWGAFHAHLRAFRRRGGVVVLLEGAFHLPAEEKRARGRAWGCFERGGDGGVKGAIRILAGTEALDEFDIHGFELRCDWRADLSDPLVREAAWGTNDAARTPLAWRWGQDEHEEPGAMLFTTCGGWLRFDMTIEKRWLKNVFNRQVADRLFEGYRRMNRFIVEREVARSIAGLQARLARLDRLSGETVRLAHRTGREKDYHRLMVNDPEMCVDLIGWRDLVGLADGGVSHAFRAAFGEDPVVVNEPGHDKEGGARGRLDILLATAAAVGEGGGLDLAEPTRGPVAWVELEAGPIHLHQIQAFLAGEGTKLRSGDFVCAVDRSHDEDPAVTAARAQVEGLGVGFLHVRVPQAFARLEEAYAPQMHRVSRKRYALDVIRGLLG